MLDLLKNIFGERFSVIDEKHVKIDGVLLRVMLGDTFSHVKGSNPKKFQFKNGTNPEKDLVISKVEEIINLEKSSGEMVKKSIDSISKFSEIKKELEKLGVSDVEIKKDYLKITSGVNSVKIDINMKMVMKTEHSVSIDDDVEESLELIHNQTVSLINKIKSVKIG